MSLHLSKCHIVGHHMSRLNFELQEIQWHIENSVYPDYRASEEANFDLDGYFYKWNQDFS